MNVYGILGPVPTLAIEKLVCPKCGTTIRSVEVYSKVPKVLVEKAKIPCRKCEETDEVKKIWWFVEGSKPDAYR